MDGRRTTGGLPSVLLHRVTKNYFQWRTHATCEIDQPSRKTPAEGLAADRPGGRRRGPRRGWLQ